MCRGSAGLICEGVYTLFLMPTGTPCDSGARSSLARQNISWVHYKIHRSAARALIMMLKVEGCSRIKINKKDLKPPFWKLPFWRIFRGIITLIYIAFLYSILLTIVRMKKSVILKNYLLYYFLEPLNSKTCSKERFRIWGRSCWRVIIASMTHWRRRISKQNG